MQTRLCSILPVHSLEETLLICNCISSADLITNLIFSWFRRPRCHCISKVKCMRILCFMKPWDCEQLEPLLLVWWKTVSRSSNEVLCIFKHILHKSHMHYEHSNASKNEAGIFPSHIMNSRNKCPLDQFISLETNLQIKSSSNCPSSL